MELILRNARVVDPKNNIDGLLDIGIDDEKITAVGTQLPDGKTNVDCKGKTIIPGVIDTHVHVTALLGGHEGYYMVAKSGVTGIIDFAGPIEDVLENAARVGCGLNVGCIDAIKPDSVGANPSKTQIDEYLEKVLENGAIGLKILGGHYPLTPEAIRQTVLSANARNAIAAIHAGSTEHGSDIHGMREAIELSKGSSMLMAHVNSYCRGKHYDCLEEVQQAFQMLRDNPNVLSDSYLSIMNGTSGFCENGVPKSTVTGNCLKMFGYEVTEEALGRSILDGITHVSVQTGKENLPLTKKDAYDFWRKHNTNVSISFPVNSPAVALACTVERRAAGGEFLIPLSATDGGGIARNNMIGRLLALHKLEYLSLADIVYKSSLNAAKVFGLANKGHLGVGADADITVLNEELTGAVLSYAMGQQIMKDQVVTGSGAHLLTTEAGRAKAAKNNLPCIIADLPLSAFYKGFLGKH
ncbi:MAG: amidohydrolase family protein [Spirochaetes bacterium]|nr:amidohydrolase family protein [Spirochaetota bacterium]